MGLRDWIRQIPTRLTSYRVPRAVPAESPADSSAESPAESGLTYAPQPDGEPDPGEVVWGWVAYEENDGRGKDRPVLILAAHGEQWLGLMLTSKDHDRDATQEARWGRHWMDVGTGAWDPQGRPSEVRLDRLIVLQRSQFRREGAALDAEIFTTVVAAARRYHDL